MFSFYIVFPEKITKHIKRACEIFKIWDSEFYNSSSEHYLSDKFNTSITLMIIH